MRGNTEWLDDLEARAWRSWIRSSAIVTRLIERDLKTTSGLTLDDYEVLVHLSEAPNLRLRLSELGDRAVQSPSRLSQRLDRLSARGYVRRIPSVDDRRGVLAVLTAPGVDVIAGAAPGHVSSVREHFIERLSRSELEQLAFTLPRLALERLEAVDA